MSNIPTIRPAAKTDHQAIWEILEPVIREGKTYPLPRNMNRKQALDYWFAENHRVFVAILDGRIAGTYYLRPNNGGGGSHVANCGYVTHPQIRKKGIAGAMCRHSLEQAGAAGFAAMQFNFVIASNREAVRLWTRMGFETLCALPKVFDHPELGLVDALVMFKEL